MKTFRNFFIMCALFIGGSMIYVVCSEKLHSIKDALALAAMPIGVACSINLARQAQNDIDEENKRK